MRASRLLGVLVLFTSACRSVTMEDVVDSGTFEGITFSMVERAHDGNYAVPLRSTRLGRGSGVHKVDANSDLVVTFETAMSPQAAPLDERREKLLELVDSVTALADDYRTLNAAEPEGEAGVQTLRDELESYDARLRGVILELPADNTAAILTGTFDGRPPRPQAAFANLTRWIESELLRLQGEIDDLTGGRQKYLVSVQAFLDPRLGQTTQLHVRNYDTIPAGEYKPIDRYALKLTDAERAQLTMRLEFNRTVARGLAGVMDKEKREKLKQELEGLVERLKARVKEIQATLEEGPPGWAAGLRTAVSRFREVAADDQQPPEKQAAAKKLADSLERFAATFETFEEIRRRVSDLRNPTDDTTAATFDNIVFGADSLLAKIQTVTGDVRDWDTRLGDIRDAADKLGAAVVDPILAPELRAFLGRLQATFPASFQSVKLISDILKAKRMLAVGGSTLEGAKDKLIFRVSDDAPDAEIELPRAGLSLGDTVTVRVFFHESDSDGKAGDVAHEATYRSVTTLTGLHREIDAKLIFARAAAGTDDARKWKPNAAATADWHYYYRTADTRWRRGWNRIDPAIGLHAAFLDQQDDSVEIGVGLNVSFFGGFVVGGYGWNLNATADRAYYFIGLDLIELLQTIGSKK